jgi:hypothetical protein
VSWRSGADHFSKSHRDDVRGECTELTLASIAAGSPALTARRAMGVRQSEFVRVHRPKREGPEADENLLRRALHSTVAGRCNGRPNQLAHATCRLSSVIPGRPDAVCARIKRSSINRPVAAWDFEPNPRCDWAVYRRAQIALCKPFSGRVPSHRERTRCMGAFFDDAEASGDHGKVKHLKKWPFPLCAKTCFVTVSPGSRNGRTTAC